MGGQGESLRGGLEIRSEEFKSLFPSDAYLERITRRFRFIEGPVWNSYFVLSAGP
jgi:hypothetical protein